MAPEVFEATQGGRATFVTVLLDGSFDHGMAPGIAPGRPIGEARANFVSELKAFHRGRQSRAMAFIRVLESRGHASDVRPFWIANVVRLKADSQAIAALCDLDGVLAISADVSQQVADPMAGNAELTTETAWGVTAMEADRVWNELGYTGSGVLVAMLDTGVDYTHSDLENRMWRNPGEIPGNAIDDDANGYVDDYYGYDFSDADADPMDDDGHGTVTAGIVAGDGTGGTITGVAPGASIMACKVLTNLTGVESSSWEAVQYALENGADVINLSIGWIQCMYNPTRATWRTVLENAMAAGVIVCAAAGNEGNAMGQSWYCPPPYNVRTPGDVPGVITLGAVRQDLSVPLFSSVGPVTWQNESPYDDYLYPPGLAKPELCAPGAKINSLVMGGGYSGDYWSGTSTSSAHASGAAALMLEKNPYATQDVIKGHMVDSAVPLSADPDRVGAGALNAFACVSALSAPDMDPPSPITDLTATPGPACDEVTLQWTAPGDDGSAGTCAYYDVRYAGAGAGPIDNEGAWDAAIESAGEPEPSPAGSIQTFTVGGLDPDETYCFAVRAVDDNQNVSGISNSPVCATGTTKLNAAAQATDMGTVVSGFLAALEQSDNDYLILEEAILEEGAKPTRHDELIHTWTFSLPPDATDAALHLEAFHSVTGDGDDFEFFFSEDGVAFTHLATVYETQDEDQAQVIALPGGAVGDVYIRVEDTDREKKHNILNRLYLDQLFIRFCGAEQAPPVCGSYVQAINLKLSRTGTAWKASAAVHVNEIAGTPLPGADVSATWYFNDMYLNDVSGVTDDDGVANLPSAQMQASNGDVFKIVVNDIVKDGCSYDPSANLQAEGSIIVDDAVYTESSATLEGGLRKATFLPAPRSLGSESFTFHLNLEMQLDLSAEIYDASGRLVRRLAGGIAGPGPRRLTWDGTTAGGRKAAAGIYYYRISAGDMLKTGKLILVR